MKVYDKYGNEISKRQSVGYAEPTPVDPDHTDQHFYISHHTIPKQHNNIRIVFDGACLCIDISLSIHSRREPNITSSETALRRILKQPYFNLINKFCTRHKINWSFQPPTASHMNGSCESMVRTIMNVLRGKLMEKCRLTDEVMHTLL